MYVLSHRIVYFLEQRGWYQAGETENFVYYLPPDDVTLFDRQLFKVPIDNDSEDYQYIVDNLLTKLDQIYPNNYRRSLQSFRYQNTVSINKHLTKKEWIKSEEKSRIEKIGIYDIYIPERY